MMMRKKFLVAYGLGGCWPGYKNACIIESCDEAIEQDAFNIATEFWHNQKPGSSLSYIWEEITTIVNDCALYQSRLRLKAKAKVNQLPYAVHSMGKTFLAKQIYGLRSANDFLKSHKDYGVIHANYAEDVYLVAENESPGINEVELSSTLIADHVTL